MMISQSAIRDFYNDDFCKIKWSETYLNNYRSTPSNAMIDGLIFEQLVIGESRGGETYSLPKLKSGKPSKRELDLIELSEFAKQTIKDLEIKILEVQPEWMVDDLIGHPDCLVTYKGEKAILDLKYTGVKENESCKWNPYAWDDLEYKDFRQALHYVEMYYLMHGEYLPFFYLVFGKSGWVKFICVDISQNGMDEYRMLLDTFRSDFKTFEPKPIKRYEICRKCNVKCNERTEKPNIININI